MMKINSFVIQPNKLWARFKKRLPPCLTETLIVMMKSDVIIEHMALPIEVQIGTSNKTTVRTRSTQKKVLRNHRGPVRDNDRDYQEQRDYQMKSIWIGLVR